MGISAKGFLDDMDAVFGTTDIDVLSEDGRWLWEVGFLSNSCSSREDDWEWPHGSLSDQEGVFLPLGEVRCDWTHQAMETRPVWPSTIGRTKPSIWYWR